MKTGYICASGFNVVATATRGNRRLVAVVLGAPSSAVRAAKAAYMFETAFNSSGLNWLMPSSGTVYGLQPINAAPPNLHEAMCGKQRRRPAAEAADEDEEGTGSDEQGLASVFSGAKAYGPKPSSLVSETLPSDPPVEVYIGPKRPPRDIAVAKPSDAKPVPVQRRKPPATVAGKPPATAAGKPPATAAGKQTTPTPQQRPAASKPKRAVTAVKPPVQ
jgi:D-alanyl-D-alanine carboxypeptidase